MVGFGREISDDDDDERSQCYAVILHTTRQLLTLRPDAATFYISVSETDPS